MTTSRRARLMRRLVQRMSGRSELPLDARRAAMDRVDRLPRPRRVDYAESKVGGIPAIVATPTDQPPERHVLYLHGGGYCLGSPKSHIAMCARLARRAAAEVTVIDYRLAPEHPFPAAREDAVAAYLDMIERIDPGQLAIAGDSAGGGLALAAMCELRDAGHRLPGCAYLLSPWTDLTASGESVRTHDAIDPMIDAAGVLDVARAYAGECALDDPGCSPLFADLAGLPPMLVQTGTDEVLLSDSTRLVDRAIDAGLDVELDLAEGMWHVYPAFAGVVPEATDALVRGATFLRTHLPAVSAPRKDLSPAV